MIRQNGADMVTDCDVIIIGSGPAGCSAAINCSNLGMSVIVITKHSLSFPKPKEEPSESIHHGFESLAVHLGLPNLLKECAIGTYNNITRNFADAHLDNLTNAIEGYHIIKSQLVKKMALSALNKNIPFLAGESVTGFVELDDCIIGVKTKSSKKITAKYIIDASGRSGIGGKLLKITSAVHSQKLYLTTGKITDADTFSSTWKKSGAAFFQGENEWLWVALERKNTATFTCSTTDFKKKDVLPSELDPYKILITNRFTMFSRSYKNVSRKGLLLTGDAALCLEPLAGQGILNAVYSGIKASETVFNAINNPEAELDYLNNYNHWLTSQAAVKTSKIDTLKDIYHQTKSLVGSGI